MKSNLEYQLRKNYGKFKLYDVYKNILVNGRNKKVFLYRTTEPTIKINPQAEEEPRKSWSKYDRI